MRAQAVRLERARSKRGRTSRPRVTARLLLPGLTLLVGCSPTVIIGADGQPGPPPPIASGGGGAGTGGSGGLGGTLGASGNGAGALGGQGGIPGSIGGSNPGGQGGIPGGVGGIGGAGGSMTPTVTTHPCNNPQPWIANHPSGYIRCDTPPAIGSFQAEHGHFIHREEKRRCPALGINVDFSTPGECATNQDCTSDMNGRCVETVERGVYGSSSRRTVCEYGCLRDSECAPGHICLCRDPVGKCVRADCTSDADCLGALLCTYYAVRGCNARGAERWELRRFACQRSEDTCGAGRECDPATGADNCFPPMLGAPRRCAHTCVPENTKSNWLP